MGPAERALELAERGKLDEALVVYRRCIEACNATFATFANGRSNNRAIDDRNAAVDKIGHLALTFLTKGEFKKGFDAANDALPLMPSSPMLDIRRAHALMFLGRVDEARSLYLRYRGRKNVQGDKSWENVVLEDFAELRKAGITRPSVD